MRPPSLARITPETRQVVPTNPDDLLHPITGDLSIALLERLAAGADAAALASAVLPSLSHATGSGSLGLLVQQGAVWQPVTWVGRPQRPPERTLALAADQRSSLTHDGWCAVPLAYWPGAIAILAGRNDGAEVTPLEPALRTTAAVLSLAAAADRTRTERTCKRLMEMFREAAAWRRADKIDSLLRSIAETATRLLNGDRASIFLHDAKRGVLIARPALGVEGGVLEVAADAGVVGAVMESGQPRRWATSDPKDEVNRKVDKQLSYQTKSLVAVPLRELNGRLLGVFEVLNRLDGLPFDSDDEVALTLLADHAASAIMSTREREKIVNSRERVAGQAAASAEIVGNHPAIESLRAAVSRVAKTDLSVLLLGANGTGKEVIAKAIHFGSTRWQEPFVAVNCAALVESLLESELFGHEKGAFTDAVASRPGKFELASGGTLFLDEIGDLSQSGQAKLLRALEEKVVVRVGGSTPISTDVRVIAATNQPLAEWVAQGRFRQDLFYRLNIVTLHLPPLAERGDDILLLAKFFLDRYCRRAGRSTPALSAAVERMLLEHHWPGNVRELRNLMERVAYLSVGDEVVPEDIELVARGPAEKSSSSHAASYQGLDLAEATRRFQVEHIEQAIRRHDGRMTEVAEELGLHRPNLYRKMRQLGMETH